MTKNVARTVIGCIAFMALLVGLLVNRVLTPPLLSNAQLAEQGLFVYDVPRKIQDFNLLDYEGKPFANSQLVGQWSLVFFGYTTCPDVCPLTLAAIRQFKQLMQEKDSALPIQVTFITVDPQRDTPEKLAAYVHYFGDDYLGVTGTYIDIFTFARQLNVAFGYQPVENGDYLVSHSGEIMLINPNGDFHGFFKLPHTPERMAANFSAVLGTWQ